MFNIKNEFKYYFEQSKKDIIYMLIYLNKNNKIEWILLNVYDSDWLGKEIRKNVKEILYVNDIGDISKLLERVAFDLFIMKNK